MSDISSFVQTLRVVSCVDYLAVARQPTPRSFAKTAVSDETTQLSPFSVHKMAAAVSSRALNMPTRIGHAEPVQALTLDIPERPLSLAERGALAQKEFARLEAAHKKAMSLPKAQNAQNGWSSSPNGTNHRTPRSAFDSRLAELADVTQRSHRTPRPTKVLGDTNPFVLQGPNMEDPVMCTGSLLHAYGGLGLRRGSNHGMSSRD